MRIATPIVTMLERAVFFGLGGVMLAGCVPRTRWYEPTHPTQGAQGGAHFETTQIAVMETEPQLTVTAKIKSDSPDFAIGTPRLTTPNAPACASGTRAGEWLYVDARDQPRLPVNGMLKASFPGDTDARQLLQNGPATLDVPLIYTASPVDSQCLRLPVLDGDPLTVDWQQAPVFWFGGDLRFFFPTRSLRGTSFGALGSLELGPFIGPVRLGLDLGLGVAAQSGNPPAVEQGSYGMYAAGLSLDSPPLVWGRVGLGAKLAYDVIALTFTPHGSSNSSSRGVVHGPRFALRLVIVPKTPSSRAFRARPDAWSTGLELYSQLFFHPGDDGPTPAAGFSYFGDIGLR